MPRLPPRVNDMAIRLMLSGCTNRPFYHIVAMSRKKARDAKATEQLGSYDPMPNADNEKLVSLNFERLRYWLACGANATKPVQQLLGLAGFFPVHPLSYIKARRNHRAVTEKHKEEPEESGPSPT
ncbi:28S ribosomal protein S16, mitochondrial-like [Haliotis rufescens]|uniref:28S ribosomal protein S16, mitochondrial-like n=1 Tax=Haliotis rufescens TaxID=6454 RepID=UPI001EB0977E|nr:28S ribosomal protein S16, mitochondrial-like [Haliotis rufescens]